MATSAAFDGPSRLSYRGPSPVLIAKTMGAAVAVVGLVVLAGWLLGVPALIRLGPGWVPMKANAALGLLLSGVALWIAAAETAPWQKAARLALGAAVLALGAASLAEHIFEWRLGIDELLARDTISGQTDWPGRPSLVAAVDFILVGAALLALDVRRHWRVRLSEALSLALGFLAFVALEGYAFGKDSLYSIPAFSTLAPHAALCVIALAVGVFIIRPTSGLMRNIIADGIGGATLRRLLPISLIVPLAVGWARLAGERAGYFDAVTGVAILVAVMAASLMLLAFVTISPLAAVEARNHTAEEIATERIRRLNRVYAVLSTINHVIVRERNLSTVFERTCRIAVEQGDFSAAWVALPPAGPGAPLTIAAEAGDAAHGQALRTAVADPAFATSAPMRAFTEGRLVIVNGGAAGGGRLADCPPLAGLAAAHGYRAVACFPLRSGDDAIGGVLVLCSPDDAWFDADEVRLLDEMAMDVGFAMDVSRRDAERARTTAALRDSQVRLERAVRAGNVGLWEWSLVSDAVYYSLQWKRQLGYEDDAIPANFEAWRSRVHPDDVERAIAAIGEYLRGQAPHLELEYRCRHKDGTYRDMLAHATVLLDERGTQVALLGAHVDVTRYTELQAQFLQAQKMESLGRLAGGIAHDFNNLLTIINGTADLALLRPTIDGERDDDWRSVRDAGERAATLTRQLLAISRKQVLQVEVLDPNEVLAGIEGLLRRLIGEDVLLQVSLAPDAGRVRADAGQIEQVVVNLAVNARDAMPAGGTLTIETRPVEVVGTMMAAERSPIGPGRYVVVSVTDTGEGMDEATQARAFEPFFTTKEPGKGTGLGLSTVFGIVRQCGGTIRLRSARRAGTTFEVYLPSVGDPARRTRSGPHQAVVRGTETILVVEDEPALRLVARKILENAGYTVLVAANGEEALTHFRRAVTPVHLLLTDVVMPGMSGPALVGRVREEGGRTSILYTSGYADDSLTSEGLRDERVYFLAKPYTGTTLLRKVREVLDAKPAAAGGSPG
jgi:signal transduction histidine kinase/ActR/RegA family two-component response regulator